MSYNQLLLFLALTTLSNTSYSADESHQPKKVKKVVLVETVNPNTEQVVTQAFRSITEDNHPGDPVGPPPRVAKIQERKKIEGPKDINGPKTGGWV